jgi:hypothetical protein
MTRVLIVEDETRIASFLEKGLRASGFGTALAATGEEAALPRRRRPGDHPHRPRQRPRDRPRARGRGRRLRRQAVQLRGAPRPDSRPPAGRPRVRGGRAPRRLRSARPPYEARRGRRTGVRPERARIRARRGLLPPFRPGAQPRAASTTSGATTSIPARTSSTSTSATCARRSAASASLPCAGWATGSQRRAPPADTAPPRPQTGFGSAWFGSTDLRGRCDPEAVPCASHAYWSGRA